MKTASRDSTSLACLLIVIHNTYSGNTVFIGAYDIWNCPMFPEHTNGPEDTIICMAGIEQDVKVNDMCSITGGIYAT